MHKDQLSFVNITPFTDFLITSSIDGAVKFWKKAVVGIESVKEFKAHNGEIKSVSVSQDGRSFATAGLDKTVKIFDIVTFGMDSGKPIWEDAKVKYRFASYFTARNYPQSDLLGS